MFGCLLTYLYFKIIKVEVKLFFIIAAAARAERNRLLLGINIGICTYPAIPDKTRIQRSLPVFFPAAKKPRK